MTSCAPPPIHAYPPVFIFLISDQKASEASIWQTVVFGDVEIAQLHGGFDLPTGRDMAGNMI